MKKLIIVINTTIPFGNALNAMAHTVFGMGHRFPDAFMPDIYVYLADDETIREFKTKALHIAQGKAESVIYADFANIMAGGTTDEQLVNTHATKDIDMKYYAVSICADENILSDLMPVVNKCKCLPNYQPYIGKQNKFAFLAPVALPDNHDPRYKVYAGYKLVVVFNKKQSIELSINSMVEACIDIGRKADFMSQHLITYTDADGNKHANISYHGIPIVTAKNQNKLDAIANAVQNDTKITSAVSQDSNEVISVIGVFGDASDVDIYTKPCSLWTMEVLQQIEDEVK